MSKPTPPDDYLGTQGATKEDWEEFRDLYADWVAKATDEDLLAEMVALPVEGRPFSPSEAWRFHQCELRRRTPAGLRSAPAARKTTKP